MTEKESGVVGRYMEFVKFSHTVFALPFALISMLIAAEGFPPMRVFLWILIAMVAARTMAMTFNRLADEDFDRLNPRTANRGLVTGEVSRRSAWALWMVCSALFFFSAAMLNRLCLYLSPIVWVVLNGYSLTKRFTRWTHLFLGLALGLAPLGAWAAVTGRLSWEPVPLGFTVLFWVAGFDIIYSLQDEEVDKRLGLHSLTVGLGARRALLVSRVLHAFTVLILVYFGFVNELGRFFFIGVGIVAVTLVIEQGMISPEDRSRIGAAFFNANGLVSLSLLLATGLDIFFG